MILVQNKLQQTIMKSIKLIKFNFSLIFSHQNFLIILNKTMGNKAYTKDQVDLVSSHPVFKNAKVVTENDQRRIVTTVPSDDEGYNAWKKSLSKHENLLSNSQFLLLPKKHTFSKQGLCAHSGNVTIEYDYFPYLLSQQIANRHQKQQRFRESDLWYLLYSLLGAKNESYELVQRVGDIRPENVFINYDGVVKVGGLVSYPNEHENYKKAIDLEPALLAPEDVEKLALGAMSNQENQHSELFSIGLTVLAAGILENPSSIYDFKTFSFNKARATQLINKWRNCKQYSQIFRSIISNLVEFHPEDRLATPQIWAWVNKYEVNIKSKEKFLITSVPAKIENALLQFKKADKVLNC